MNKTDEVIILCIYSDGAVCAKDECPLYNKCFPEVTEDD